MNMSRTRGSVGEMDLNMLATLELEPALWMVVMSIGIWRCRHSVRGG